MVGYKGFSEADFEGPPRGRGAGGGERGQGTRMSRGFLKGGGGGWARQVLSSKQIDSREGVQGPRWHTKTACSVVGPVLGFGIGV